MIYYGQERGVTEQRGTMRWHDGDADLTAFHRSLSTLRDTHPVLRRGRTEPLELDDASDRVTGYARVGAGETLLVLLNFDDEPSVVDLDRAIEPTDCRTGESVDATDGIEVRDIVVLRTAD